MKLKKLNLLIRLPTLVLNRGMGKTSTAVHLIPQGTKASKTVNLNPLTSMKTTFKTQLREVQQEKMTNLSMR